MISSRTRRRRRRINGATGYSKFVVVRFSHAIESLLLPSRRFMLSVSDYTINSTIAVYILSRVITIPNGKNQEKKYINEKLMSVHDGKCLAQSSMIN